MIEGKLTLKGRGEKIEDSIRYRLYGDSGARDGFDLKIEKGEEKAAAAFDLSFGFAWADPLTITSDSELSSGLVSLVFIDENGNRLELELEPEQAARLQKLIRAQLKTWKAIEELEAISAPPNS